jgi:LEA14-like dessication related protein
MNKRNLYIGGAVVAVAVLGRILYKNIYLAGKWDFNIGRFKIDKFKPLTVTQTIEFINKSNFKVTVKDINIEVLTEGVKIGSIVKNEEQTIAGKGVSPFQVTYVLDASLKDKKASQVIRQLISNLLNKQDLPLDFVGTIKVKGLLGYTKVPIFYSTTGKTLYQMYLDM